VTAPLGIYAGFGIPVPFPERMRLIRAAGFTHVALWWPDAPRYAAAREHLAPAARAAGLRIDHAHVPFRSSAALWAHDEAMRRNEVARHAAALAGLARYGIPRMVMHTGAPAGWRAQWRAGLDSFRRVAEAAEAAGVTVALENTRQPECLDALLRDPALAPLRLCYDVAHDALHARRPLALLTAHPNRLAAVHWSDTDGRRDRHWLPGDGALDHAAFASALSGAARDGVITLEVTAGRQDAVDPAGAAETFLARAFAAGVWLRSQFHASPRRASA
jgi:sugar phosphate isomerase/epimerase